jgi:hypothetical protein
MKLLRTALVAVLAAWLAVAPPVASAKLARGGASPLTGFLPSGHWQVTPTGQSLTPVFPLADSVTNAAARIHQAYYDGTNAIPYDVAVGVEFGAYPYICNLVSGPPGMVVEQTIYTTFQNKNYCRVSWQPTGAWNGEVEVSITDQQNTTIDMSWALWTVGQYSSSTFTSASGGASISGSTLTITGSCTGSLTPGMVVTGLTGMATGTYIAFEMSGTGCDGTYALSTGVSGTPSGTLTGTFAQGMIFASASGSGTTCSYSTPCSLTQAFGPTYASTSYPGAVVYAFGGTYSFSAASFTGTITGTTMAVSSGLTGTLAIGQNCAAPGSAGGAAGTVTEGSTIVSGSGSSWTLSNSSTVTSSTIYCSDNLPTYTDNVSGTDGFSLNVTKKPNALIGLPGATVTLDATSNNTAGYPNLFQLNTGSNDWYMENIQPDNYNNNAGVGDVLINMGDSNRETFDQIVWNNAGYGDGSVSNLSMFTSTGIPTPRQYLFITDSEENNRESGPVGNNYAFTDLYCWQYALVQRNQENSPGNSFDAVFYGKSDVYNSTYRENLINVTGTSLAFSFGQNQVAISGENDVDYNLAIGGDKIEFPVVSGYTLNTMAAYRNTILAGSQPALVSPSGTNNVQGPLIISATPTTGTTSLAAGTWCYRITSLGTASGESTGRYGGGAIGNSANAGSSNEECATTNGSQTVVLSLSTVPSVLQASQNVYRGTSSGGENQYLNIPQGTTSWTDNGTASWTSGTIPTAPGDAVSTPPVFIFENNAVASTAYTAPSGATISQSGQLLDSGGSSAIICLNNTTTSGCTTGIIGDLNLTWVASNPGYLGQVGYKIQ